MTLPLEIRLTPVLGSILSRTRDIQIRQECVDDTTTMPIETSDVTELEIERRFNQQYVYGTQLLAPNHYLSSIARRR